MSKKKKRIPRLTEEQYGAYLMALKEEPPTFSEGALKSSVLKEEQHRGD